MGLIGYALESRASLSNPQGWLRQWLLGGIPTAAGVTVNERNALKHLGVLAAVRVISEDLASLPLPLYRRLSPRGKERAVDHPAYALLHDAPNPEMSSFTWRLVGQAHVMTWGNHYAEIVPDGSGRTREIWPLRPDRTKPVRSRSGELRYVTWDELEGREISLPAENVLHIKWLGFDGRMGYSPVQLGKEAIGIGLAAEEWEARFFENDSTPNAVLKINPEKKLSDEEFARLRKEWDQHHKGRSRAHRMAILEGAQDIQTIGLSPSLSQFVERHVQNLGQVARLYRLAPHKIGEMSHATYTNIEHQGIDHWVSTMRPIAVNWEQEIQRTLLTPAERRTFFAEFVLAGVLRGDQESRFKAYAIARQWGWFSADDVRELENMNDLPDGQGKIYMVPLNMVPATAFDSLTLPAPKAPGESEPSDGGAAAKDELKRALRTARKMAEWDLRHERRSAEGRRRVRNAHIPAFVMAGARVLEREAAEVVAAAEDQLERIGPELFREWVRDYYVAHQVWLADQYRGVLTSLGEAVQADVAGELGIDEGLSDDIERFVLAAYLPGLASRWVAHSQAEIRRLVESAADDRSAVDAIRGQFDRWLDGDVDVRPRAERFGSAEAVRAGEAVAKETYRGAGIRQLRWFSFGESCEYCADLNGRTVGIDGAFLRAGDAFQPDGVETPLTVATDIGHAPAHEGCDCSVVAAS